ncbi:MAG: MATE family efflux transporter [Bacteroidota bacterium]
MTQKSVPGVLSGPIAPYLLRQSLIFFLGLVCLSSLSLVDVYFIGRIGAEALTAVGFSTPVFLMGFNVILSLGTGITAVVSRVIGADTEKVPAFARGSLLWGFLTGLLLGLLGWALHDSLFGLMGAGAEVQHFLRPYMHVLYLSFPVMGLLVAGLSVIRAYGAAQGPTRIMLLIVILNVALDPLFMFGWGPFPDLGMVGAAWATFVALAVGLLITFRALKGMPWHPVAPVGGREIWAIALPSAGTRLLLPVSGTLITGMLADFGDAAVAAYGIGYRIDVTLLMYMIALSSVMAPFVGQNYGARHIERLRTGFRVSLVFALAYGLLMALVLWLGHDWLGGRFTRDVEILAVLDLYYQIVPWGYAFNGILMLSNALLNVLHRPRRAALLSIIHTLVFYVPLAWWAFEIRSLTMLFAAYPVSLLLAAGLGSVWGLRRLQAL